MKKIIRKALPLFIIQYYGKWRTFQINSQFKGKEAKEVFQQIYDINFWGSRESASGTGSELSQTETIIQEINSLLPKLGIKSVLDIPCGDFNWMQHINLRGISYMGADIVSLLIEDDNKKYNKPHIQFSVLNLIKDSLPQSDIIINRDCLVHLSYQDIYSTIQNIKASGSTYLLSTTFTSRIINYNITTGQFRPINLQKPPFSFQEPILLINENCTEGKGENKDKSLGLWLIADIKLPDTVYK